MQIAPRFRLLRNHMRDTLLPRGTLRRRIIKILVWVATHPRRCLALLTAENLRKVSATLRAGGLRAIASRTDAKLSADAVMAIPDARETIYLDTWLAAAPDPEIPAGTIIDIIVPIYGAYDYTKRCLETVWSHTDIDYELWLVDDRGPDERIPALLSELDDAPRPAHMQALYILRNEENLGFIGSVNRAFDASQAGHHDIVLLNTDTEVPQGWLSRLVAPLYADAQAATVTPYANSATICSFPAFAQNNDLPEGITAAAIDDCLRAIACPPQEIPTGVGFAMAIRRQCLDDYGGFDPVYGQGYGEENDWCCRVAAHGYHQLHAMNLFIYHKHGASFGERKDKKREWRIEENLAKLDARYPRYETDIHTFLARDPERPYRDFLRQAVHARRNGGRGVLCLCHSSGGGTLAYQEQWIAEHAAEARIYTLTALADGRTGALVDRTSAAVCTQYLDLAACTAAQFQALLRALGITEIRVNHLLGFPLQHFLQMLEASGVPCHFFVHDYYAVCPSYTLMDGQGQFCGIPQDAAACDACLQARHEAIEGGIRSWRGAFAPFLARAAVTAPSQAAADLLTHAYPHCRPAVVEHHLSHALACTYDPAFATGQPLHVAAIGALSVEKGADILYDMTSLVRKRRLPVRLHIIGYTYRDPGPSDDGILQITGRYEPQDLPELLREARAAAVILPALWPETYCYTVTEAMACGYPVLCYDLGAPAERVRRTGQGCVISEMTAEALLQAILSLQPPAGA